MKSFIYKVATTYNFFVVKYFFLYHFYEKLYIQGGFKKKTDCETIDIQLILYCPPMRYPCISDITHSLMKIYKENNFSCGSKYFFF